MTDALPVPRIVPVDVAALEKRASTLAAPDRGEHEDASGTQVLRLVSFRLGGTPCSVETSVVERALVLGPPQPVPVTGGSERLVAFVLERPLPLRDLVGATPHGPRPAAELDGAPALVVSTSNGPVVVAVEGPLELSEERLVANAEKQADGTSIRISGRLANGAALVDADWLASWAAKVG